MKESSCIYLTAKLQKPWFINSTEIHQTSSTHVSLFWQPFSFFPLIFLSLLQVHKHGLWLSQEWQFPWNSMQKNAMLQCKVLMWTIWVSLILRGRMASIFPLWTPFWPIQTCLHPYPGKFSSGCTKQPFPVPVHSSKKDGQAAPKSCMK